MLGKSEIILKALAYCEMCLRRQHKGNHKYKMHKTDLLNEYNKYVRLGVIGFQNLPILHSKSIEVVEFMKGRR